MKKERSQPYVRWARQITENDVIITFNYDLVLDKLVSDLPIVRVHGFPFATFVPGDEPKKGIAPVLKLHGSVNWRREDDPKGHAKRYVSAGDDFFALKCDDEQSAIAAPGPTKLSRTRELGELWKRAESAIENARAVVFVGYRFPPTDAEARRRLFDALGRSDYGYKAVHTVLGPESPKDTARLGQLLHSALRQKRRELDRPAKEPPYNAPTYNLVQHQLYAEDFFSVCNDGLVQQPYRWPT